MFSTVFHAKPRANYLIISIHLKDVDVELLAKAGVTEAMLLEMAREAGGQLTDAIGRLMFAEHEASSLPRPAPARLPAAPRMLGPGG